jgi:type I restriction enzyme S subunit
MNKLKLINKFIFYYLQSEYQLILSLKKEGGVPAVNKSDLEKLPIPIPPLTVQTEIVRILDTFTDLTAELTAELTSRKMQYNYYREQLLNFDEGEVEWKTLGEVCRFINGRAYKQPELLESGKYPVLRVGNFFTNGNWYYSDLELEEDKYCDNGDLLYAWSASFGPKIWEGGKVIYHYHIWKVIPNISLIQKKFLFYLLAWDTESLKSEHGTGSTMMHIGKGSIEQRLVPIPPLEEQARIVSILDKFDTLTTSITEGLPKEIELRKKQYEYYRDRLLNFNKLNIDDEKR